MYLHCKNIFIEGQTFAEETGDNRQQSPRGNVWSSSYSEKAGEGGGVEGLEFELIQKTKRSMDATAEFQSCSCSVMYND